MQSVPIIVREPRRDFKRVKKYAEESKEALDEKIKDLEGLQRSDDAQLAQATKLRRDLSRKVDPDDVPHAVDKELDQKVSYNDIRMTKDDLQRLKNLRADIQEDIDALSDDNIDALPAETRDFRTLSIRQVKQHIHCSHDVDDDDLDLYHWELKTRSHPFQAFRKADGSIVKGLRSLNPYATSGQVRLVYTDNDGQVISNVISLDNVRRNLTRAAKAASYRYQDNDPTFLEAVDNVWERILGELDASDEQVLNRTAPSSVGFSLRIQPSRDYGRPMRLDQGVPFSLRVFRDRVHKLYARFDTTVDDIRALGAYDDIIPIVEYVDPTIRLDKTGKNDALRKIQHGKNMRLVLPPYSVLRLRGGADDGGGGGGRGAGAKSRVPPRPRPQVQKRTRDPKRVQQRSEQTASAAPGVLTLARLRAMANPGDILQLTPNSRRKKVPVYFVRYIDDDIEFVGEKGKTKRKVDLNYYKTSGNPWASFQNDDDVIGDTTAKSESLLAAVIASGQPLTAKLLGAVTGALGLSTKQADSDNDSVVSDVSDLSTVSAAVALDGLMLPRFPTTNLTAAPQNAYEQNLILDAYEQELIAAATSHKLTTTEVAEVFVLQGIDKDELPPVVDRQTNTLVSPIDYINKFVMRHRIVARDKGVNIRNNPVAMSWANRPLKTIFDQGQKPESGRTYVARKYIAANGNVFLVEPTQRGRVIVRTPGGIIRVFKNRDEFESGKKIDGEAISWYQFFNLDKGAVTRVAISPAAVRSEIAIAAVAASVSTGDDDLVFLANNRPVDMAAAEARYDSEDMAVAVHPDAHLSTSESETEEPLLAPVQRAQNASQYLSTSESESEEEEEAPRGDITKMMSSMPAEWSSTEDDLEFAESSAGEEDDAPFEAPVSNTLESVQESSGLDFAASSATDTASETSETPVATSSGLDFAESSAVETGSSGVEFAASSAVDTASETSETPAIQDVASSSGVEFAASSAVDTNSSGGDFAESSAVDTASETSETPAVTSSGLDFAASSAVDTNSSGGDFAESSAVDTASETSETPALPDVASWLDFAESSAVDTSSSGVDFAESSAAETGVEFAESSSAETEDEDM